MKDRIEEVKLATPDEIAAAINPMKRAAGIVEERGYSLADMEEIKRELESRQREWERRFDDYINAMLVTDRLDAGANIVQRAKELADLRMEVVDEKRKEVGL